MCVISEAGDTDRFTTLAGSTRRSASSRASGRFPSARAIVLTALDLALLTLFWLVFLWPILVARDHFIPYDLLDQHYMFQAFIHRTLAAGESPWWSPDILGGYPIVADPLTALFYPPNVAMHLLTRSAFLPYYRMEVQLALHILWAAFGGYALARSLTGSRMGGLVAALTFAFGGFFAWHLPHLSPLSSLSWLPWVLFAYHRAVTRQSLVWVAAGATSFGMLVLAGHAMTILQAGYLIGALAIAAALLSYRNDPAQSAWALGAGVAIGLLGAGLAMIQLLPSWELSGETSRAGLSWAEAAGSSFRPLWLLTVVVPGYFAPDFPTLYWAAGDPAETNIYLGLIPLVLAVLGVARANRQNRRLIGGILAGGAICLVLAFGSFGPVYRLVYDLIPGFDHVRRPGNFIVLVTLAGGLLAAFGVRSLEERHSVDGVRSARVFGRLLLASGALLVAGLVLATLRRHAADDGLWQQRLRLIQHGLLTAILIVAVAYGLVRTRVSLRLPATILAALLVLIVAIDLRAGNANKVYAGNAARPDRYIGPDWAAAATDPYVRQLLELQRQVAPDQFRIYPDQAGSQWINGPLVWGVQSIDGYSVLWPREYQELFELGTGNLGSPVFDLMNVRYVMTTRPLDELHPGFDLSGFRLFQDGWMKVYENTDAMPRAWVARQWVLRPADTTLAWMTENSGSLRDTVVVSDPPAGGIAPGAPAEGGQARIVSYTNDRVVVHASMPADGYLILADTYYPGWTATVDGRPARVQRSDHALRAVWLPAGEHDVVFTYRSTMRALGTILTIMSGLAIVGLAVASPLLRRRRAPQRA